MSALLDCGSSCNSSILGPQGRMPCGEAVRMTKMPLAGPQGEQERNKVCTWSLSSSFYPVCLLLWLSASSYPKSLQRQSPQHSIAKCSGSKIPSLSIFNPISQFYISMLSVSARYHKKMTYLPLNCACLVTYTS